MIIKKEDLEKAILDVLNSTIKLEAMEKALRASLEKRGLQIEQVDCPEHNVALKEVENYQNELDRLLEGAKETITSGYSDATLSLLNSLNKIERFNADEIHEYYLTETYFNLVNIVNRSKEIEPLYVKQDVPLPVKKRHREAILCYINGRFDACCVMCRSIIEMMLKELCRQKFKNKGRFEECSLFELINTCSKFNILKSRDIKLAQSIKGRGNIIHTEVSASEQDAVSSIKETQNFLKNIL